MNKLIWAGVASAALLAGCNGAPETTNTMTTSNEVITTNIITPPAENAIASEVKAGVSLNLAPDELTLVSDSGSARHIAFGMDKKAATDMVAAALGSPIEQAAQEDCGAGKLDYAAFRQGLSLYFQEGKFAGWNLDGRENGNFTTANGIGIGTTRKELEDSGSEVELDPNSTIGHEFTIGEMSGILSGTAPTAKVESLWAGVNCIAR